MHVMLFAECNDAGGSHDANRGSAICRNQGRNQRKEEINGDELSDHAMNVRCEAVPLHRLFATFMGKHRSETR